MGAGYVLVVVGDTVLVIAFSTLRDAPGVLLYTIMFGESPFATPEDILKMKIRYPSATLNTGHVALLKLIFNPNPAERITLEQIKAHPWLHEYFGGDGVGACESGR